MQQRPAAWVAALLIAGLVGMSCAATPTPDSTEAQASTSTSSLSAAPDETAATTTSAAPSTRLTFEQWQELWSWVPLDELTSATMTDLSALRALAGGIKPSDGEDARAAFDALRIDLRTGDATRRAPSLGYHFSSRRDWLELDASREAFGFGLLDTDAGISADVGDEVVSVFALSGQLGTIDSAVRSDPAWSDLIEERSIGGQDYVNWGDDRAGDAGPLRPLGVGGQLAATESVAVLTDAESAMANALESRARRDTVSDIPLINDALRVLHDAGAYEAVLAPAPAYDTRFLELVGEVGEENLDLTEEELAALNGPRLRRYEIFVGGSGFHDGGYEFTGVMIADDNARAQENAELFPSVLETGLSEYSSESWASQWDLIDVRAVGPLTVVRLRATTTDDYVSPFASVLRRESLFSWVE